MAAFISAGSESPRVKQRPFQPIIATGPAVPSMDATARTRSTTRRSRRKLFLFCRHPVAQQQFTRLLKRTDFDVILCRELLLPEAGAEAFDAEQPCLAVIDASNVIATLEFVRMLRLEQRSVHLLVLLPKLEDQVTSPLLRLGVKGLLTYQQAPRELARSMSGEF